MTGACWKTISVLPRKETEMTNEELEKSDFTKY